MLFAKSLLFFALSAVLWTYQVNGRPVQRKKLIDLSYTYNENIVVYPTAKKFSHDLVFKGKAAQGFYLESYDIATAEHAGTHMDAPSHFCDTEVKGKMTCPWSIRMNQYDGVILIELLKKELYP